MPRFSMALPNRRPPPRPPTKLLPFLAVAAFLSLFAIVLYKVTDAVAQTRTVVGHNLAPTPWHLFPPKPLSDEPRRSRVIKILRCTYLSCPAKRRRSNPVPPPPTPYRPRCPEFFRWVHHDLEPWARGGISAASAARARDFAAFRAVIVDGRLFLEMYYDCVQSRAMFTVWGLLQLLKRYPGMVPDVDMAFDCMDKPAVNRAEHGFLPLPLFRYCTNQDHFDIPFPDWSFWGWPETNLNPWDEEFRDIKCGSKRTSWEDKVPQAYWKGNPDVGAPIRTQLLNCNHSSWGAQILRQNWAEEAKAGYEKSKLSNQCNNQYKIYSEGYAWSVSLKYILSCGSLALIISPQYEDFFSRGLIPRKNYWPVSSVNLCQSIKYAVEWGNAHPYEAERIGKAGQDFMESLSMNHVYDYMFHLITEYSKLQQFKPVRPPSSFEVCPESLLCHADPKQRQLLEKSAAYPSPNPPCSLQPADSNLISNWLQQRRKTIKDIEEMELNFHTDAESKNK